MRDRLRGLVVASCLAIPIAGCGGHSPPASRSEREAKARALGVQLIDVLERDDLLGFDDLLSARLRERSKHERHQMFSTWRAELVPYAQALRDADWTVSYAEPRPIIRFRAVGRSPEPLAHVVDERGRLRID